MQKHKLQAVKISFAILIAILIVDLYAFRGFNISKFSEYHFNYSDSIEVADFNYEIIRFKRDSFKVYIKNNSIIPAYLVLYRNDKLYYKLEDKEIVGLSLRSKIRYPEILKDEHYGFDCGTGLGLVTIHPFEEFEGKIGYNELLQCFNLVNSLSVIKGDEILDPFHSKTLLTFKDNELIWDENISRLEKDSIELDFFLPLHSIFNGTQMNAYSNTIKISYLDIVKSNMERYKNN